MNRSDPAELLKYLEGDLETTPLELLARAALRPAVQASTARKLFGRYDAFLGILDDERRTALKHLRHDEMASSGVWRQIREMSHQFQAGLTELFYYSDEELKQLIISYGVF